MVIIKLSVIGIALTRVLLRDHCHLYKWEPFLSWDIFKECILSVGDNENKYLEEINPLLFPRLAQVHILIIICHWLQFKAFSPVYCDGDCP